MLYFFITACDINRIIFVSENRFRSDVPLFSEIDVIHLRMIQEKSSTSFNFQPSFNRKNHMENNRNF